MASLNDTKQPQQQEPSVSQQQQQPQQSQAPPPDLDITIIQEENSSFDASQASTEDLNQTLQEEMALRKNLDTAFADAVGGQAMPSSFHCGNNANGGAAAGGTTAARVSTIQQRIAHFEQKLVQNQEKQKTMAAPITKPPQIPSRAANNNNSTKTTTTTTASDSGTSKQLKVFLRVRPCIDSDKSVFTVVPPTTDSEHSIYAPHPTKIRTLPPCETSSDTTSFKSSTTTSLNQSKEYEFTQVFPAKSTQHEIYERTAAPLVNQLCSGNQVGKSALLFSYGITNAGKTYTVLGDVRKRQNSESWGIVPRCLTHVLQKVSNTDLNVYLSYFEIYNENVFDLLPPAPKKPNPVFYAGAKPLKIRERNGQTIIKGLTKHPIQSIEQGLEVIYKAKENRHTASNHLNRHSSRSHCVCQITVSKEKMELIHNGDSSNNMNDDSSVDTATLVSAKAEDAATLWVVDLAGSERSKRTNGGSLRQKEASFINKSLMTLMGCLTRGEKNYRDSKLTVLFMHHWMKQRGSTSMIVNVHPSPEDYEETQHVLAYAISTKTIPDPLRRCGGMMNKSASSSSLSSRNNQSKINNNNMAEYDYDGRKKNTTSASTTTTIGPIFDSKNRPDLKKTGSFRIRPKPKKTHAPTHGDASKHNRSKRPFPDEVVEKKVKKHKLDSEVTSLQPSSDVLQAELSKLQAEMKTLKQENEELRRKLESVESTVREEVSDEMLNEMTTMTKRYEDTIRDLKTKLSEATSNDKLKQEELERAQTKISELMGQVDEYEEEISRMVASETHSNENKDQGMVDTDANTDAILTEKEDKIKQLEQALSESEATVKTLERSKQELIRNYEKLLLEESEGEEGEDDDTCGGTVVVPSTSSKVATNKVASPQRPQRAAVCSTEPRVRPRLGLRMDGPKTMNTPAGKSVAARIAMTQPKPWSMIASTTAADQENKNTTNNNANQNQTLKRNILQVPTSDGKQQRQPFAIKSINVQNNNSTSNSSSKETKSANDHKDDKYMYPAKPAKADPETGAFLRPRGRPPTGVGEWDSNVGAWALLQ